MLDKLKRVRVRLGALLLVILAALPEILDALGSVDLKSILEGYIGVQRAAMVLVILAFMKPMVHMLPKETEE